MNTLIEPALENTFFYDNIFCVLDDEDYEFPEESEENVEGEWSEDDFQSLRIGCRCIYICIST